ncbi:MAG TPA: glycoside hydrolase family 2 TIM barrel-domain containing protein [Ignavibacteriaceae bacterium]|nr:glycoside hydrolase family 2 TIM barrel-domain containing protein [Ignavibacteriaceae bacterium]
MSLKNINGINIPYQNGIPVPSFEKQSRQIINLKGVWKKQRFASNENYTLAKRDSIGYANILSEAAGRQSESFNDGTWQSKNIPSVENTINSYPTVPEFYEDGVWYRYKFNVADSLNGKFIKLMFYSVNYVADVWINGIYAGYHEGGYTPFAFDVSNKLHYGADNIIAVRVDNPAWGTRKDIVPYYKVDWFNYTGIIHDVYLEVSNPISIVRTNVVPQDHYGSIQTTISLLNKSTLTKNVKVKVNIYDADVNSNNINSEFTKDLVGASASFVGESEKDFTVEKDSILVWRTNLQINNPRVWYPKTPNLYIMKVVIEESGIVVDEYYTQFGIRKLGIWNNKITLNNKPSFFTGVARHEDHPTYGRSIPIDIIYSDLLKVKDANSNMLRTAHYPNHPYTYLITDRLGVTVVEEIPVWWFDESYSWSIQNNIRHIHEQMFREMVFKDYNRPSVFMWSTCNECLDVSNRSVFINRVRNDLNTNFPDGRFITQSAAADRPGANDPSQAYCDVAGWTMYFGIFHGGEYYSGTRNFVETAQILYPNKPVLNTEFGYWSGENGTSYGTQQTVFNETFGALSSKANLSSTGTVNSTGCVTGTTWWCIFDWYTSQHPNGFQSMGLYNMQRTYAKPVLTNLKNAYLPYYNLGGIVVNVDDKKENEIKSYSLNQNYPNPFNPSTEIKFSIQSEGFVELKIFNMLGSEVASLINENREAGEYSIKFNADVYHLTSGVYFCKLKAGNFAQTIKMIFLK